jgi:hypothetical protein
MHEPHVVEILDRLSPADTVLDIGGWARPFNRANFVIDAEPYETRGYYGPGLPAQGGPQEYFSKQSWCQRDICSRVPYPFADKSIDFVICSHVLEDIRDPLWVCAEMVRIGKRGYIEVPSRVAESQSLAVFASDAFWARSGAARPGAMAFLGGGLFLLRADDPWRREYCGRTGTVCQCCSPVSTVGTQCRSRAAESRGWRAAYRERGCPPASAATRVKVVRLENVDE